MADPIIPSAPATRRGDDVDVYHGVPVADPYRWLEDGDDPEVAAWVAEHNQRTRQALEARPTWGRWHERLSALIGLPTVLSAAVRGDRLFVLQRDAGADQFSLVVTSASEPAEVPRVLLDPAGLAADSAVAIDWYEPSNDGSLVAFGLSEGGTEDSTLYVLDVSTGERLPVAIPHTRAASVAWKPDNSGFWYTRYREGEQYHRHVYLHTLGADHASDPVVFDDLPNPQAWPDVAVSEDGRWLLLHVLVGWSRYDVWLVDTGTGERRAVIDGVDAQNGFTFHGDGLVGITTVDAPNGRLVAADIEAPHVWRTVVAESDAVVSRVVDLDDSLLVVRTEEAVDSLLRVTVAGELRPVPDLGVVSVQSLTADDGVAFVTTTSFRAPATLFRIDGAHTERWAPAAPPADVLPQLTVTYCTYPSLDGTSIGVFIAHRADVTPNADTPLVLTGYGGFAITESPVWMPNVAAWCAAGGAYAIAGLRGGYERGEAWHQAGRRDTKQNVFDDFHAAADWLVAEGFTSRDRLAIAGGSNGGLLMGVAVTQRPDLARAVWCAVPLLDMIRFPQFLIARLWTDEYGDPDVEQEFGWLHAYSPYHRVREGGQYPAVLFTTAEGDTRVDPLHARKMAALLTHASASQETHPILLFQDGRAGHGVGKPASKRVIEGADVLSFFAWQLAVEDAL